LEGSGAVMPVWASVRPIRLSFVPHTAQVPRVAGTPFLKKIGCGFAISRFTLHLMQYAPKCLSPNTFIETTDKHR